MLEHYHEATHCGLVVAQDLSQWDALAPALQLAVAALPPPPADANRAWTLLVQDADTRGVYSLPVEAICNRAEELLRWDGNSLLLAAPGLRSGVLLDCEVRDDGAVALQLERWSADGWRG